MPSFMPKPDQALKWFWRVTVPLERGVWRMLERRCQRDVNGMDGGVETYEMYCWKVDVPWMEGWLVCWCCQTS